MNQINQTIGHGSGRWGSDNTFRFRCVFLRSLSQFGINLVRLALTGLCRWFLAALEEFAGLRATRWTSHRELRKVRCCAVEVQICMGGENEVLLYISISGHACMHVPHPIGRVNPHYWHAVSHCHAMSHWHATVYWDVQRI